MIEFIAKNRSAICAAEETLTTGSVGVPVHFRFSQAWAGLGKTAVFREGERAVDVALTGDSCTVPPEMLTTPGGVLTIGVYGTDGTGAVVIPTVYAQAGPILRGAEPAGIEPTPQTPALIDQLLAAAQEARDAADEAEALAQSVRDDADSGAFDGAPGPRGPKGEPAEPMQEHTVADSGAVTQELAPNTIVHFTGALTALTLTLAAPESGPAQYHFDFRSGDPALTLTIPASVTMPDGWGVEAGKRYEIDILDGYGLAQSWAQGVSA